MDLLYESDQKLGDLEDNMCDILDNDAFHSPSSMSSDDYMDNDWLNSFFEDPVLNDKMITDAVPTPRIRSEHSYSTTTNNDPESPFGLTKIEELDFFGNNQALDLSTSTGNTPTKAIPEMSINLTQSILNIAQKNEPTDQSPLPTITTTTTRSSILTKQQPTIILATSTQSQPTQVEHQLISQQAPIVTIKTEPHDFLDYSESTVNVDSLPLPPTPPSSSCSDSDGGLSPQRSAPSSPVRHMPQKSTHYSSSSPSSKPYSQPFFTNPIPQSGVLILSEEEKRTLISEGYPVPTKLPLTKQEEKNLKKIRRKIKNKISAQESRRKKKEYVEALEKRVESFSQENNDLKKKLEMLETNNRSLLGQLQKLQSIVGKVTRTTTSGTGTVLMVLVLCFAVFLGNWTPSSLNIGYSTSSSMMNGGVSFFSNPRLLTPAPRMGPAVQDAKVDVYSTPNMKSRVLLSMVDETEDSTLYSPYGPITPGGTGKESQLQDPLLTCEKGPEISMPTSEEKSESQKVEVVTVDARIGQLNETVDDQSTRAIMHPDIAASADFLKDQSSKAIEVETA